MTFPALQLKIKKADGTWEDVTTKLENPEFVLKWGREAETLDFSLDVAGTETDVSLFSSGRDVEFYVNNVLKFAGNIIEYKPAFRLNKRKISCSATSYLTELEKIEINKQYAPADVADIIEEIAVSAGLTTDIEPTGLVLSPNFKHVNGLKACLELAEKAGCVLKVTPNKVLKLRPRGFGNNLITNPSFETTTGWTIVQYSGSPSINYDSYEARSGSRCIKVDCLSSGDEGGVEQTISILASKRYRFSAWMKGTNTGKLVVTWLDSNNNAISSTTETKTLTTDYQEITVNAVSPSNAAKAMVSARGSGQGVARIDDVYAVRVHELIDNVNIIEASKSEEEYKRRNKIIVVGGWTSDGQRVEAVAQEGAGDRPLTIYDLTVTSVQDAERIAKQRLNQLKVTPVRLNILALGDADFEAGDYAYVKIQSLSIDGYFLIESVAHDFSGRVFLSRLSLTNPEYVHKDYLETLAETLAKTARIEPYIPSPEAAERPLPTEVKTFRLMNKPPLKVENAQSVKLNSSGYVVLDDNATAGSFEYSCMPAATVFRRWLRFLVDYDVGQGSVVIKLKRSDGYEKTLSIQPLEVYEIPYYPNVRNLWTEDCADWDAENATLSNSESKPTGLAGSFSIKATATTTPFRMIYPKTRSASLNLSGFKELLVWIYTDALQTVKVMLHTDATNYFEKTFSIEAVNDWKPYSLKLSEFQAVGSPLWSQINYIVFEFSSGSFACIDTDFMFIKFGYEKITAKFELSRADTSKQSPSIKYVCFAWEGGG
ncbi:MAG: carbohydrate binding domain-containing protein [Nitrososphaerota archaeon]